MDLVDEQWIKWINYGFIGWTMNSVDEQFNGFSGWTIDSWDEQWINWMNNRFGRGTVDWENEQWILWKTMDSVDEHWGNNEFSRWTMVSADKTMDSVDEPFTLSSKCWC